MAFGIFSLATCFVFTADLVWMLKHTKFTFSTS